MVASGPRFFFVPARVVPGEHGVLGAADGRDRVLLASRRRVRERLPVRGVAELRAVLVRDPPGQEGDEGVLAEDLDAPLDAVAVDERRPPEGLRPY